jgi:2-polyprenyl-6-methoxyphenol hydroxylase-like FAD-dependent oxidoreductase
MQHAHIFELEPPVPPSPYTTDVLIVGAGASGLTMAVELARRGVDFRLIEKAPEAFRGSRGKGIQPRTQEVFEDLGVIDRLVSRAGVYPPQRLYDANGGFEDQPVVEPVDPTPTEPYMIALLAPQFVTEGALRERLAELGHAPAFGRQLVGFDQSADGLDVRVVGSDGESVWRVRYLIGADGGRSFVRGALQLGFPGETLGVRAIVADVHATGASRDAWHRWGDGTRSQIALCPLAGTDMFQLQGPVPLEGDIDLSADGLSGLLAERTGRRDLKVTEVLWASVFNMNARLADRYRQGRVFLVGDAAHIHPPTGGQGLNTSVQDAYNLGWKLASVLRGAPEDLLDTYEEERREIAAGVLGLSTKLLKAMQERADRSRGRETYQLNIGYPHSSLSLGDSPRQTGVLAGDRAPDGRLQGAGGLPTRVFSVLKGTHWTLIGFGVSLTAGPAPRAGLHIHRIGDQGDLADANGDFEAAYGLQAGEWTLIRPDGYVGAIVTGDRLGDLEPYLAMVGLAADQAHS